MLTENRVELIFLSKNISMTIVANNKNSNKIYNNNTNSSLLMVYVYIDTIHCNNKNMSICLKKIIQRNNAEIDNIFFLTSKTKLSHICQHNKILVSYSVLNKSSSVAANDWDVLREELEFTGKNCCFTRVGITKFINMQLGGETCCHIHVVINLPET